MDLFNDLYDGTENILPKDGIVNYYGQIFSDEEVLYLSKKLLEEIPWTNDQAIIFGKLITTRRKYAWFGELPFQYTYSKITKKALVWNDILLEIKKRVENITEENYNSCLLNLYHTGEEGMSWHSDSEKELKDKGVIASLSFGVERRFDFKHRITKEKISIHLPAGSLLVMKGETQTYWLHQLPVSKRIKSFRINLTFRQMKCEIKKAP